MIDLYMRRLLAFFIVLFLIITGSLVYWQTYWPNTQVDQFQRYQVCVAANQPVRGRIFDRNGVLLAYSEADKSAPCGWRRRYMTQAHPSISSFLGYFSYVYGSTGIEHYYNDVLTGASDPYDYNSAATQFWNKELHRPVQGNDIYLSIDIRVQDELDHIFSNQVTGGSCTQGSTKGSIIVEDPHTGQLLGMLSRPYFDGDKIGDTTQAADNPSLTVGQEYWNQLNTDPSSPLLNRAIQGQYPPGSAFKTLTLIAALNSGTYSIHSTFTQAEATTYTIDGFTINSNNLGDYTSGPQPPSFPLELGHAYAYSDNVVFARVGTKVGADTWLRYAQGFGMSTPDDVQSLPVDTFPAGRSTIYSSKTFDPVLLSTSAFGQGELFLSPLTMEMIGASVAADGAVYAPRFLLKSAPQDSRDPKLVAANDPNNAPVLIGNLFRPETALQIRQAMRDVVTYGSVGASGGSIAAIKNLPFAIGAKTGTAQLSSGNPHAWLVSIAPDNGYGGSPATLAAVIMKEQGGEGACQAPIAGQLYQYALPIAP